jgi:DtxR family Mn-dependent transcriptional regulator
MELKLSKSEGDYLKAIYNLTLHQEMTSTMSLAEELAVKPPSITSMLIKLANQDPPLVDYQKHQGVQLTEQGKQRALRLLRRHRLLELFLVQNLNYSWEEVHAEAEELEHVISPKFEERIAAILGDPQFDPHGDPIPDDNLQLPASNTIPLVELKEGQPAIIRRVQISQTELLRYLNGLGIYPGNKLWIDSRNPFDQTLQLLVGEEQQPCALGPELSNLIYVER